eukprot:jgi/Galph1/3248/GphlegSOOS_G1915.1
MKSCHFSTHKSLRQIKKWYNRLFCTSEWATVAGNSFVVNPETSTKVKWLKGPGVLQAEAVERDIRQRNASLESGNQSASERFRRMRERRIVPNLLKKVKFFVSQDDINSASKALSILNSPGNNDVVQQLDLATINALLDTFQKSSDYDSICVCFRVLEKTGMVDRYFSSLYRRMLAAHLTAGKPTNALKLVLDKHISLDQQTLQELMQETIQHGQQEAAQVFYDTLRKEPDKPYSSLQYGLEGLSVSEEEHSLQKNMKQVEDPKTLTQIALRMSLKKSDFDKTLDLCETQIRQGSLKAEELALLMVQVLAKVKGYQSALAALEVFEQEFPQIERRYLLENLTIGLALRRLSCSFGHFLALQICSLDNSSKQLPGHLFLYTHHKLFSVRFLCETFHFNREGNIRRAFELSLERGMFVTALELFRLLLRFGYDRPCNFSSLGRTALEVARDTGERSNGRVFCITSTDKIAALEFLKRPEPFVELMAARDVIHKHDIRILVEYAIEKGQVEFASLIVRQRLLEKSYYSISDFYLIQKLVKVCKHHDREDLGKQWTNISNALFSSISS